MSNNDPGWWPFLRVVVLIASWSCVVTWATSDHTAPRGLLLVGFGLLWLVVWLGEGCRK